MNRNEYMKELEQALEASSEGGTGGGSFLL